MNNHYTPRVVLSVGFNAISFSGGFLAMKLWELSEIQKSGFIGITVIFNR
jgi:hypothetical protein